MTSIIKVDTIQDQDGNNIINENANTITIGASGDTITIPAGATFDASASTTTLPDDSVTTAKIVDANVTLAKLSATGTKDATTFLRGDNTFASAGGVNTPAFSAYANTDQNNLTDNTWVKLQMNAEFYDTDSKYDITNYRFTPTIAGTRNNMSELLK
jgi:hypothetical protein